MEFIVLAIFVLGYLFIALEHTFHIDKAASALLTGTICWGLFVVGVHDVPAHLAEDFSAFQEKVPGFYFFLGGLPKGADPKTAPSHHTPTFYVDDAGMRYGIRAMVQLTLDYLK